MVGVHRAQGLNVVVFVDDHLPARVHVFCHGMAKINLVGNRGEPQLILANGLSRGDIRRDMRVEREQQAYLMNDRAAFTANTADAQIDAAMARGKRAKGTEPRAAAARYDRNLDRIVVEAAMASA